jgi:phage terminase Nu1 subunit (DNA packaging protein)
MDEPLKYLTTRELAAHFDVTPRTVQNWMRAGIVTKFERHGPRRVRFVYPDAINEIRKPNP